jgi:hypothetical protein
MGEDLSDKLKGVSAFLHTHGAPDFMFNAVEASIQRLASLDHAVKLMEESGCFKGEDVRKLLGLEKR